MAKRAIVMYLEQARIYGEDLSVTRSEVLLTKPDGKAVLPHNRIVTKADNKTMGESFLNELIYVLGAGANEPRQLPFNREVLVYTSNENDSDIFEDIPVFNGSNKVSYTITQDAVNGYTTEIKASDDGNTIEIINTHIPVVPPKEEPKKEEPATPAPVVEVKVEQPAPTVTLIQTTNKPTGISFFESLFAK